ncbi:MAG TPA: carboxypeptidase-like regulatory domain-containing protein [Acidimicrobiales bacterium]|nr:carboxypeptidase-like regulatory domain-containing protein [Acidimicrobiales bacterium]
MAAPRRTGPAGAMPGVTAVVVGMALALAGCGGGGPKLASGGWTAIRSGGSPVSSTVPGASTSPGPVGQPPVSATAGSGVSGPGTVVGAPGSGASATTSPPGSSSTTAPTTTTSPPPAPSGPGVYGYVTAGHTCGAEPANHPCPPRPVAGDVEAQDSSGSTVASTATDAQGRYAMRLPPGRYTLVVDTGSNWPRCPSTTVTVGSSGPTRADISCDTGIR